VLSLIAFFIYHVVINVGMQIGLRRSRYPLPLISHGGSATMMFFMAIGLIERRLLRCRRRSSSAARTPFCCC
jgi:cell division protein FtsW (lipid II flippase)